MGMLPAHFQIWCRLRRIRQHHLKGAATKKAETTMVAVVATEPQRTDRSRLIPTPLVDGVTPDRGSTRPQRSASDQNHFDGAATALTEATRARIVPAVVVMRVFMSSSSRDVR
jgi:hypothetical protein